MSTLNELIEQIDNPELRKRISAEVGKLNKQKKFGLVFEEHLPECTPLYDIPVKKNSKVAKLDEKRNPDMKTLYTVLKIDGDSAVCVPKDSVEGKIININDLVCVAEFGEPIYPYLKPIDSVCNASDSNLWHILIEADNYHALQLLEYLYAGKVDCIYIDPPYNKEDSKDWKYNCNYVDGNDQYRHSKWLSMMEKRLRIARKLLNPADSVIIITIDEMEYLHLGCLLEEMFPEARIQMVSSLINPQGVQRKNEFNRTDEYIYLVQFGSSSPQPLMLNEEWSSGNSKTSFNNSPRWSPVRRMGSHSLREDAPNQFYPIYFNKQTGKLLSCGESLSLNESRHSISASSSDVEIVWPIRPDKKEGCWQLSQETVMNRLDRGYIRAISRNENGWIPTTLASGEIKKCEEGIYNLIERKGSNNEWQVEGALGVKYMTPGTQWRLSSHIAGLYGSTLLKQILNDTRFTFPKSVYAVHDVVRFFVSNKPKALVVDFFAGSGTTLHAVNLLNAEDGGNRRCIMVTNNEVSEAEAKLLRGKGYKPNDEEWEKLGIAHYVTWPRTVCTIKGENVKGEPLKGNYIGSDIPMSEGFKANANFFKLGFLDKTKISLRMQFKEMLPTLWMKAGAIGKCPAIKDKSIPDMLILPENHFAVLNDENQFAFFAEELSKHDEIETVFLVTDYESSFTSMTNDLSGKATYQLYRDYLDNFRINAGRNSR